MGFRSLWGWRVLRPGGGLSLHAWMSEGQRLQGWCWLLAAGRPLRFVDAVLLPHAGLAAAAGYLQSRRARGRCRVTSCAPLPKRSFELIKSNARCFAGAAPSAGRRSLFPARPRRPLLIEDSRPKLFFALLSIIRELSKWSLQGVANRVGECAVAVLPGKPRLT